jgi:hypothetical protein
MLPAFPWDTRPDDHPLTSEEVCAALVQSEGNVHQAADRLKVGSLILRKFIERSTRARAVIVEMSARLIDEADTTLRSALRDDDSRRQDWAVRFILNSKNARPRGWASTDASDDASTIRGPLINLTLANPTQWADGTIIGPPPQPKPPELIIGPPPQPNAPAPEVKSGND